MESGSGERLIVGDTVQEFFAGLVENAVSQQQVAAREETRQYLVNLLTGFTHSETLFEPSPDGLTLPPLAGFYAEALEAGTTEERHRALKRLGDVALFIAGVFSDSLNRKLVDVDYYIAMGGNAYSCLTDASPGQRWGGLSQVFHELASKFADFVDVLGRVSEQTHLRNDQDIMRLYEVWVRTGSRRALERLQRLGIQPSHGAVSRCQH